MIADNPVCLELDELIEEAKLSFEGDNYEEALKKAENAVNACKDSISSDKSIVRRGGLIFNLFYYLFFATLFVFVVGLVIYIYKRIRFNNPEVSDYV